jgi:hypothetical protein
VARSRKCLMWIEELREVLLTRNPMTNHTSGTANQAGLVNRLSRLSLALGMAALSSCSDPVNCSGGNFRNGCVPGPVGLAATKPSTVAPSAISPGTGSPGTAGSRTASPSTVGLGDPSQFADVDDKQCRSYGLIFGTRDYADCRIRLSAQHRGLDPNLGVSPSVPGSR